ncbi:MULTISPECIES: histidinol-phosphate transaminase [unclassified Pseudomonas]|uniref:histidinol-phosphate transaminase n=1 Tax=unclassified Pseudomonas TaxID=196821 RepID=UPI002AC98617|nr:MULTISPECIES: histidinol-phosphate transaminase [unclassified Pseudomonas]MEB0043004.1 histidinol-phosphate transaminase [Pseudomonas sp. MH10]MEB0079005.1 histidinol-phosphate transaminase [Pseudomonas sp. MH10out]MEB0094168.1 histidinol-phosphate transaminase [Pseudomonas sp. CCI4.2]MEB0103365.1 histidinol-phosphate transaminase [Pseudomonas sp. CCI3.2]MEB0123299.1 histidinol-phosphate transaminase [Pseudomonas sp. CCI1.2]
MSVSDLQLLARAEVRELASYNAGLSADAVRKRFGLSRVAKLGSNENPLGPAPAVAVAMAKACAQIALYPDASCLALRDALSKKLGVSGDHLVFGNGSEDLLSIISRVFLDHDDEVVTVVPSFGLHFIYPLATGAKVIGVPMTANGAFDVAAMIAAITSRTRLLMFSCPSNPVGCTLNAEELQRLLEALPAHCLLVFDEAYYEYAQFEGDYPDCLKLIQACGKPFVLLRTFSKAYSLAGLRIGYGIVSDPALADLIDRLRTPFNVNRVAQAAAVAALADDQHLHATLAHVAHERQRMVSQLRVLGVECVPSMANFLFFSTAYNAEALNQSLLRQGVILKPWREPGYTDYLRVSMGNREDNDLFLEALANALVEEQTRSAS